jgi:16S rRNA (cytidine1402-2'-O)-methyltransferase
VGLTFVPTPLGNLRDVTLRALEVLRACDLIVAEDTRVTRRLLSAYGIAGKTLWSYREQNAAAVTPAILERAAGSSVAVVSDAGTPGISDPGRDLIRAARAAGVAVDVLPGPVAFVCAAVLSGFELEGLVFGGFVPRTAGAREAILRTALGRSAASAFYESPRRILTTLEVLQKLAPNAHLFLARELTKLHEQQILGTPENVRCALEQPVRGEIVLVIEGSAAEREHLGTVDLEARIDALLEAGLSVAGVAKRLANEGAGERAEVYALAAARKRARGASER